MLTGSLPGLSYYIKVYYHLHSFLLSNLKLNHKDEIMIGAYANLLRFIGNIQRVIHKVTN